MDTKIRNNDETFDLATMSREDILILKLLIEEQIDKIKQQLHSARVNATLNCEFADPDWFARAMYAQKAKGRQAQRIQVYLGSMKKSRVVALEAAFVDAARIHLSADSFHFLMDQAKERIGDYG
jgi:hypothetical protein